MLPPMFPRNVPSQISERATAIKEALGAANGGSWHEPSMSPNHLPITHLHHHHQLVTTPTTYTTTATTATATANFTTTPKQISERATAIKPALGAAHGGSWHVLTGGPHFAGLVEHAG